MTAPNLPYRRARLLEHHRTMVERYGEHDPGAQFIASLIANLDQRIAQEGGSVPSDFGAWQSAPPATAASMREAPKRDLFGDDSRGDSWS